MQTPATIKRNKTIPDIFPGNSSSNRGKRIVKALSVFEFNTPTKKGIRSSPSFNKFTSKHTENNKSQYLGENSSISSKSSTFSSPVDDTSYDTFSNVSPPKRPAALHIEKKGSISFDEKCCVCEESLSNLMLGEELVSLSCGHFAHFNCSVHTSSLDFSDEKTVNVYCNQCENSISCQDSYLNDKLYSWNFVFKFLF
ncbi:unnamed protein product [Ambrosiozyma monospora]|uniref:Unnamed protein product n=1 Tax=Ambrosiozyma monospora TaxID=43982 RepID=A0ACB5T9I9_AMBMO|nr:unnamed protein product [Ambrosiozyma monospora]